ERFQLDGKNIPSSDQQVTDFYKYLFAHDSYKDTMRTVVHEDGGKYTAAVIRVYTFDTPRGLNGYEDMEKGEALYLQFTEDTDVETDLTVTITGMDTLMYETSKSLTESQIASTVLCILLAAAILFIVFRDLLLSIITLVPVLISICWILGTMYFIGYDVNIMTVMITSITVGLGVTYAIHAVQRFRQTADETGDITRSIHETVSHTGGALLAAAVTTIAGFGILTIAPLLPQQQFGLISAITIVYSLLTTIIVLPPILKVWATWRKKRKGYIISKNNL
ncbi:MAG: MMPL family transporter, partial [Candidatus Thermoplasmatota archaeon]|nr:MMPL family transporter [Candidatus Thermoplasmatota archaeon]